MHPTSYALLGLASILPSCAAVWTLGTGADGLPLLGAALVAGIAAGFAGMAHAARADRPAAWKGLWIAALACAGPVAAPIYWLLHVRPVLRPSVA